MCVKYVLKCRWPRAFISRLWYLVLRATYFVLFGSPSSMALPCEAVLSLGPLRTTFCRRCKQSARFGPWALVARVHSTVSTRFRLLFPQRHLAVAEKGRLGSYWAAVWGCHDETPVRLRLSLMQRGHGCLSYFRKWSFLEERDRIKRKFAVWRSEHVVIVSSNWYLLWWWMHRYIVSLQLQVYSFVCPFFFWLTRTAQ